MEQLGAGTAELKWVVAGVDLRSVVEDRLVKIKKAIEEAKKSGSDNSSRSRNISSSCSSSSDSDSSSGSSESSESEQSVLSFESSLE